MTGRERELAAINHQETDRIPIDTISIEIIPQIADFLKIGEDAVLDRLGVDGRIVNAGAYSGNIPDAPDTINKSFLSPFGTLFTGDYGTAHWYPLLDIESISDIEQFQWPDPLAYDFIGTAKSCKNIADRYALRGPYWLPLFCQACDMMSMEKTMIEMSINPKLFDAILNKINEHNMVYCKALLEAFGEDMPIFCLGDDFATQRGLMISPESWRKHLKPLYAEIFAIGKNLGKKIWFHSCGDITEVLPDLIDIGVDVWETVQLHTLPISPQKLKQEYGKHITFFGAINTQQLPYIDPIQIAEEVNNCIGVLGKGGGYICGPDHHIKPDVSPQNAVALFDAALNYSIP